jgi:UDP-GlcNAc3NAcA epimerase
VFGEAVIDPEHDEFGLPNCCCNLTAGTRTWAAPGCSVKWCSMRILTVVGARPQFIKSAPVSAALRKARIDEFIVHTGQHYDRAMSSIFFEELSLAAPNVNLGIGSGSAAYQISEALIKLEAVVMEHRPDVILLYGDTNATISGAIIASKLEIPSAHIESGLRSYKREIPEEINRVIADHCATLRFCPTENAVQWLAREGITEGVHLVGDPGYDATLMFSKAASQRSNILHSLNLQCKGYLLATVHRPYNVDVPAALASILEAFVECGETIILPLHPRTRSRLQEFTGLPSLEGTKVRVIDPVGFLDMLMLEKNARLILTDSGGVQRESYFMAVPGITLRPETEWLETTSTGWSILAGSDKQAILSAIAKTDWPTGEPPQYFGDGQAAEKIVSILGEFQAKERR